MPPTQNGHGDAILAQGAKASPRVKGHVVNGFFFFFETLVPLKINRGWPFSRGGVS